MRGTKREHKERRREERKGERGIHVTWVSWLDISPGDTSCKIRGLQGDDIAHGTTMPQELNENS